MTKKQASIGVLTGLAILLLFNVVIANALQVRQLPPQPELKVEQGRSIRYEDGSIDFQPASKQAGQVLQNTINGKDLQ